MGPQVLDQIPNYHAILSHRAHINLDLDDMKALANIFSATGMACIGDIANGVLLNQVTQPAGGSVHL